MKILGSEGTYLLCEFSLLIALNAIMVRQDLESSLLTEQIAIVDVGTRDSHRMQCILNSIICNNHHFLGLFLYFISTGCEEYIELSTKSVIFIELNDYVVF